jgi:hypothetical protein
LLGNCGPVAFALKMSTRSPIPDIISDHEA